MSSDQKPEGKAAELYIEGDVEGQESPANTPGSIRSLDEKDEYDEPASEDANDNRTPTRTNGRIAVIMCALALALFLSALDSTIVTTALPSIAEHFHSSSGYTWVGSAYLLGNATSTPILAKVSDIFGRKPMLITANFVFLIGSLVAGLSSSIGMLIAARAVQGVGGGGLNVLVSIVIGDIIPLRVRGAFYGAMGGIWTLSLAIGPIVGGALTQSASWRWCFYINLPIDGIALVVLFLFLDVKTPKTALLAGLKAIDWTGVLLVVGGTVMFLIGLQCVYVPIPTESNSDGGNRLGGVSAPWQSAEVLCLLIFGVTTLALFLFWEWRFARSPIMPQSIFAGRSNKGTFAVASLHGFVFIPLSFYMPLYFQAVRGATPIQSGVWLLPTALSIAVGSPLTGLFIGKTGQYLPPIYFGFVLVTIGYGLLVDLEAHSSWAKLIPYQIIAAIGFGPLFQSPLVALQAHTPPRDISTATAALTFVRSLFTSISIVVGQAVYENAFAKKIPHLRSILTPEQAGPILNGNIGAATDLVEQLPQIPRNAVRVAFANSLHPMWIMYCAFAAMGCVAMFLIKRKELTRKHEETVTGLEAEKANAELRDAERTARREAKQRKKAGP
ncbi:hypothetical protein LTR86_000055 [Recurvomyces mirabilis]|nr:hypothetical protein LTR86_000055 [Recurvomyces mirabilis]